MFLLFHCITNEKGKERGKADDEIKTQFLDPSSYLSLPFLSQKMREKEETCG